jgi:hypothetical protein
LIQLESLLECIFYEEDFDNSHVPTELGWNILEDDRNVYTDDYIINNTHQMTLEFEIYSFYIYSNFYTHFHGYNPTKHLSFNFHKNKTKIDHLELTINPSDGFVLNQNKLTKVYISLALLHSGLDNYKICLFSRQLAKNRATSIENAGNNKY